MTEWQNNPGEAHTDKCEACGAEETVFFDKEGYYVLCQMCYNTMTTLLACEAQDLSTAKTLMQDRFALIIQPNMNDFEAAYRQLVNPGAEIKLRFVLEKMQKNAVRAGYVLKKNWVDNVLIAVGQRTK